MNEGDSLRNFPRARFEFQSELNVYKISLAEIVERFTFSVCVKFTTNKEKSVLSGVRERALLTDSAKIRRKGEFRELNNKTLSVSEYPHYLFKINERPSVTITVVVVA